MSEEKKASLTVLGGPLGGLRTPLPDDGVVTIGSSADCSFRLNIPSVSPLQARVVLERGVATVFSAGDGPPLHVNDTPLGSRGALRNGDILWLGVPGDDGVVMLQCVLAPPAAPAPRPTATLAEPTPDIETQALFAVSRPSPSPPPAPTIDDDPLLMVFDAPVEQETVVVTEPPLVSVDDLAPVMLDEGEDAVVVDEDELLTDATPTFVAGPADLAPPADESLSTEPLMPEAPLPAEPDATPPLAPEPVAPPPPETPPPVVPDRPPAEAPPAASGPPAPDEWAPADDALGDDDSELEETPPTNPVALALAGFVGVLAVAILGWVIWRFVLARPAAAPSPAPVAAATLAPTPPPAAVPSVASTPGPGVAPAATEPAAPTPPPPAAVAPQPTPTPRVTAPPTPTPAPPRAPAAAPPQPSAEERRAQETAARVETLLGQADTALAARQYDAALGHLTEALTLDPANSRARTSAARASALKALANRRFVATRTRVQTEKEQDAGLAGFDTGDTDLRKAPDFQGHIEFEMSPSSGITTGDPWTLRVFVVNEGDKPIRIQGIDVARQVNGAGSGGPETPRARQVPAQQRVLVAELSGAWAEGTNAWSTQVTVTANKGDSLRASITWR